MATVGEGRGYTFVAVMLPGTPDEHTRLFVRESRQQADDYHDRVADRGMAVTDVELKFFRIVNSSYTSPFAIDRLKKSLQREFAFMGADEQTWQDVATNICFEMGFDLDNPL